MPVAKSAQIGVHTNETCGLQEAELKISNGSLLFESRDNSITSGFGNLWARRVGRWTGGCGANDGGCCCASEIFFFSKKGGTKKWSSERQKARGRNEKIESRLTGNEAWKAEAGEEEEEDGGGEEGVMDESRRRRRTLKATQKNGSVGALGRRVWDGIQAGGNGRLRAVGGRGTGAGCCSGRGSLAVAVPVALAALALAPARNERNQSMNGRWAMAGDGMGMEDGDWKTK